jgi:small-conductance mechanosensitive channel
MNYTVKKNRNFEARIYIGSRARYVGPLFTFSELRAAISQYQHEKGLEVCNPVRITPTTYVWDDYMEDGWEIAVIDYPRRSKSHIVLYDFAYNLGVYLLERFNQNRISIVFPSEIVMLESDEAEATHKKGEESAASNQS